MSWFKKKKKEEKEQIKKEYIKNKRNITPNMIEDMIVKRLKKLGIGNIKIEVVTNRTFVNDGDYKNIIVEKKYWDLYADGKGITSLNEEFIEEEKKVIFNLIKGREYANPIDMVLHATEKRLTPEARRYCLKYIYTDFYFSKKYCNICKEKSTHINLSHLGFKPVDCFTSSICLKCLLEKKEI